jgi:hypothetical protein
MTWLFGLDQSSYTSVEYSEGVMYHLACPAYHSLLGPKEAHYSYWGTGEPIWPYSTRHLGLNIEFICNFSCIKCVNVARTLRGNIPPPWNYARKNWCIFAFIMKNLKSTGTAAQLASQAVYFSSPLKIAIFTICDRSFCWVPRAIEAGTYQNGRSTMYLRFGHQFGPGNGPTDTENALYNMTDLV